MNRKVIHDIGELPQDHELESTLHPKKRRIWRQSNPGPAFPPPAPLPPKPPTLPPPPSPTMDLEVGGREADPRLTQPSPSSSLTSCSVTSPGKYEFVACHGWKADSPNTSQSGIPSSPRPRPRHLHGGNTEDLDNYGSEDDSNEEDEEETPVVCGIPRVIQSILETPLDQDGEDDAPAADPSPADAPAPAGYPLSVKQNHQPWGTYEFDWREFPDVPINPESRRETFSQSNVGPTTPRNDPYDIFVDIWDRPIMEHIASQTNKYAQELAGQMLANQTLQPTSRITRWVDTSVDELYSLFGILIAMGIVVKTRMEEYWSSTPDIFYTPGFSAHMSIDRFIMLNRCIHFNDNDKMRAQELGYREAKMFKIQPILSHLNLKFQQLYTPSQNIALDESLLMWKGCLEMSQLIPNKAARRGIKTYELCESQTGYLWRFEVHTRKKSSPQHIDDPLEASTPSIVLRLIKGLENLGYTLWMDNYYNSPCLARRLKSMGFDCVGTLRTDRKFVPKALHCLTKRNMRPGQIAGLTSGDVDVMVWRDMNRVAMISTYHGNAQYTLKDTAKPILILDYNVMMGGVDKKDQLLAMYPVERKRAKVWYKKLFRRLLNVSILNSYVIQRHTSTITHRNFRISLVKSLLSKHSSSTAPVPTLAPNERINVTHRLAELPMRKNQRLRRSCVMCKKLVRMFCVGCNKAVCMDPCFVGIHS